MVAERLSMRKTREILRLKWVLGLPHRRVARSLGVGIGTISETLGRAGLSGIGCWADVEALDDGALQECLYGPPVASSGERPTPDWAWVHTELRRKGVTLQLLHLEYLEQNPGGYRYSQFCEHYGRWAKRQRRSMRQVHRAGEKMFVDYAGQKPHYIEPLTGEVIEVELFLAVLGASNLTFAEATRTQQVPEWIASHVRAFEYVGGVPEAVVCDQLKSGVIKPCRYEPALQRTYLEMATHYGTVILPARPASPRDKPKVEVGVQIAERWILARLRNEELFSLSALNERVGVLREELNQRMMRVYGASRRDLFERLDRPVLKPLAAERFEYAEWKTARVNIDYHVEVDRHYYSVPHELIHEAVEVRRTASTVEIFRQGRRVASHVRSYVRGGHTTNPDHMPKAHRAHLEWSPSRLISWGASIGPETGRLIEEILSDRPHPEQGYRSCLGILRLARQYGNERLEAACTRARLVRARSYRDVEGILKHGLDRQAAAPARKPMVEHEDVRGPEYYQ
jgi:transposase